MRLVPIKEVLALDAGETVPSIRGRITDVANRVAGKSNDGEWSFQKLTVNDGTGDIVVKVWNRDPFAKTVKGQEYLFACHEGQKGLTGLKVKEDEYRGKVSKIINTSDTAEIGPVNGSSAPPASQAAPPASTPAAQAPTTPAASQAPAASAPAGNGNGAPKSNGTCDESQVKKSLNKMANLYLNCMTAAEYVQDQWETSKDKAGNDRTMSQEQLQACVSSLFIESCKTGLYGITPAGAFHKD